MGVGVSFYIRNLVFQEMRERVSAARRHGEALAIPATAAAIASEYPGAYADDDLRNRLFAEATRAGVPMELGKGSAKRH